MRRRPAVKSLSGLLQVSPGLDPHEVLTLQVSLPQADTYGPPVRESFCADLSRGAEGLPGIRAIGAISHLPLSGANAGRAPDGRRLRAEAGRIGVGASYRLTCPGYFATLGIADDRRPRFQRIATSPRASRVVIINRAMADAYWKKGESPIGRRLKLGGAAKREPVAHRRRRHRERPSFRARLRGAARDLPAVLAGGVAGR